jgi:POT family proton-dependent oligopeptide transporter
MRQQDFSPGSPPIKMAADNDELPNNVSTLEQLPDLPDVCLSGNPERPLRHINEKGEASHYALQPMFYSVLFILVVELLERFSFYGIEYTETSFLTGVYNEDWNAGMTSVEATSYVSISTAVAYTTPFLGAYLADAVLGDYWAILVGCSVFYLPGVVLITISAVPYLLGDTFSRWALSAGVLFLWPLGTGMIKSVVNVFGAKQFHPLLQSSLIESYYVSFYMCINVGSLIGGFVSPIIAQQNVSLAYTLCVAALGAGVLSFLFGTRRYVLSKPNGELFSSKKGIIITKAGSMSTIFRITILILPFSIAYAQMATMFIVQGTVMKKAYFIDAASMNNVDALSVLVIGSWIGAVLYPYLNKKNIRIPTTYKFAIGSFFGAMAIAWALMVEHMIHREYAATGGQVNVLWQAGSYILIGAGEIFCISTAYEAAFSAAPPEKKVLASAVNLFSYGGIPNVLCIGLYNVCAPWFHNSNGTASISRLQDYATAHVGKYFTLLLCIALSGIVINIIPAVRDFVANAETAAAEAFKTPLLGRKPIQNKLADGDDEESTLLCVERHRAYLKYGTEPVLLKQGSMHVNPFEDKKRARKQMKKKDLNRLYQTGGGMNKKKMATLTPPTSYVRLPRQDSI